MRDDLGRDDHPTLEPSQCEVKRAHRAVLGHEKIDSPRTLVGIRPGLPLLDN